MGALFYAVALVAEYEGANIKIFSRAHESIPTGVAYLEHIYICDGSYNVDRSSIVSNSLCMSVRNLSRRIKHPYIGTRCDERNAACRLQFVIFGERWQRFYDRSHALKNSLTHSRAGVLPLLCKITLILGVLFSTYRTALAGKT